MRFALPLGLLGLIALAALILIYILKPKYQDKKVSSTYVWKLSLRYQKRKVPLQWLKSSLLLVVQILIIIIMALMMAQPLIVLATKTGEKVVILEASASMLAEDGGKSRFDRAISEIGSLAQKTTAEEDKFSVILAGEEPSFIVRRSNSASYVKQKLSEAECAFGGSDLDKAMELAKGVLEENPEAEVYLYTDCNYTDAGKVKVVNMARSEWNAAVLDFSAKREKGFYVFTAEIASYGKAAEIAVNLNVDGKPRYSKLAKCEKDGTTQIVWGGADDTLKIDDYKSADVHLAANDSFVYDNEFYIFNDNTEKFKVRLESNGDPGFIYSALHSVKKCQVDLVTNAETGEETENTAKNDGYDLYVYDGVYPEEKPTDGAVWLINPPKDLPKEWGVSLGNTRNGVFSLTADNANRETYKTIMNGITISAMEVTEYSYVNDISGYESVLKYRNDPVLFAKNDEESGLKTVVFAFDLHKSTLPVLLVDFPLLINNLCGYSMANTVDNTLYAVGDEVTIKAKPNATLTVTFGEEIIEYSEKTVVLNPGVYTVTQTFDNGREAITNSYYVRIPKKESVFNFTGTTLVNPIVINFNGTDKDIQNDTMDICIYVAAVLLALVCVEWGLQYREQY